MSEAKDAKVYKFPDRRSPPPRKIVWAEVEHVIGHVEGLPLVFEVVKNNLGAGYVWVVYHSVQNGGRTPLAVGSATTLDLGKEAARRAAETQVLVVTPVPDKTP